MPREESNCSSFFGALCFRYEVYNFLHKGNLSWEASLLLRVGQIIKKCLLLITKSLKIQDKLILIQNKSFFGIQKFFKSLAAFLESIVLLLEILKHKLFDCGMWHIYHLASYEMMIQESVGKSESGKNRNRQNAEWISCREKEKETFGKRKKGHKGVLCNEKRGRLDRDVDKKISREAFVKMKK